MDSERRRLLGALAGGVAALPGAAAAQPTTRIRPGDGGTGRGAVPLPPGDAVAVHDPAAALPEFRFPLDGTAPTGTTGGYAKEMNARQFPIGTAISGVHMFLNPGASRELHWHAVAAEWAYVIDGRCQTVVLTPEGTSEINNFEPGDLWFFPKAHGHSIQTIGDKPCHFLLAFDNGDTSPEHETFGITDWIDVTPKELLALDFGVPAALFDAFPKGEVYIQQGPVLQPAEALDAPWPRESTHKFRLLRDPKAVREFDGGSFRLATMKEWPVSQTISGGVMTIRPGAMLKLHWHPAANEMSYFLGGHAEVALFGSGGRSAVQTFRPGDIAYVPQGYGHAVRNIGDDDVEVVQVWDNGDFQEIFLDKLLRASPRYLVANNLAGVPAATIDRLARDRDG